jgi:hypothetical protein
MVLAFVVLFAVLVAVIGAVILGVGDRRKDW